MFKRGLICKGGKIQVHIIKVVFRAIFDLSKNCSLNPALTQLNSAHSSTQLDLAQLSSTQLDSA